MHLPSLTNGELLRSVTPTTELERELLRRLEQLVTKHIERACDRRDAGRAS